MIVADAKQSLQITGNGDVLEPHDGIIGPFLTLQRLRSQKIICHFVICYSD